MDFPGGFDDHINNVLLILLIIYLALAMWAIFFASNKFRKELSYALMKTWPLALLMVFAAVVYLVIMQTPTGTLIGQGASNALQRILNISTTVGWIILIVYSVALCIFLLCRFALKADDLGPDVPKARRRTRHLIARRLYLNSLLKAYQPKIITSGSIESRMNLERVSLSPGKLLVTGAPGMGKSTLLKQLLVSTSKAALKDNSNPIPIFIDLDMVIELGLSLPSQTGDLFYTQNGEIHRVDRMLQREAETGNLLFILDGSIELSRPASQRAIDELCNLVWNFREHDFVLASPPQAAQSLHSKLLSYQEFRSRDEIALDGLSGEQISKLLESLAGETAASIYERIKDDSSWLNLARKPFILSAIANYHAQTGRFPKDLLTLFRETKYATGNLSATNVEEILPQLASQMVNKGRLALPLTEAEKIAREATTASTAKRTIKSLIRSETLVIFGDGKKLVKFGHPLLLAFFLALSWWRGNVQLPGEEEIVEFTDDPLLDEAFVFFNHLERDDVKFARQIARLAGGENVSALYLVTSCILAKSGRLRPLFLTDQLAESLIKGISSFKDQQAEKVWGLLQNRALEDRLHIYSSALANMEQADRFEALSRIGSLSVAELQAIFRNADEALSREMGKVWINLERREALKNFIEVYEHGPDDRRRLAVEMMGHLSGAEVRDHLVSSLHKEDDPQVRVAILRSLENSGSESALIMLNIITKSDEAVEVRVCAAEILNRARSAELENKESILHIVRTLREQIPDQIRSPLESLLEYLREKRPIEVKRWEASVNPYIVGKPVEDKEMFFGREKVIHDLKTFAWGGNNVLICGERRIGKTSILKNLSRELRSEGVPPVIPVYIDLQGLSEQEFYSRLITNIVKEAYIPESLADRASEPGLYSYEDFNRDLGHIIEHLRKSEDEKIRLALLLDEVDVMISYPQQIHSSLRQTFGSDFSRNLAVVLAGLSPIQKWSGPGNPFYDSFERYPISSLDPDGARSLVTAPVAGTYKYDEEAVELIIKYSQYKPYEIQSACRRVINYVLSQGRQQVTVDDVMSVYESQMSIYILQKELASQVDTILEEILNWAENNPDIPAAQLEERLENSWVELREVMREKIGDLQKTLVSGKVSG